MPPNDAAPFAALTDALKPLLNEAEGLRGDVHAIERARKLSARINMGVLTLLVFGLVLVLAIAWQSNQLAHQVARTNATLADCTVPGGKCYESGNARTGKAIGDVIRAQTLVSECARLFPGEVGPTYDAKLEACVAARLGRPVTPTPAPGPTATPRPSGTR